MADVKISDMTPDSSVGGGELLPVSDAGSPKSVTVDNVKDFIIDAIEAIAAAGSVSGADGIFILQGGVLKPADIDLIAQHAIDTIWGKAAESAPDSADILALKDGGTTEKTVTLALLAEYVRATIEAAILNVSDLADGSAALAGADHFLVTQGSTGKRVTLTNISDAIYAALDTYVAALGSVTTSATADVFYCIQGGTEKKVTLAEIAAYIGALYTVPSSTTANGIPQWTNATGGLKDGLTLVTTVGAEGSDNSIPSEQGVRESMKTLVFDLADIDAALVDVDTIVVDDGAAGTTERKSAISRLWTYITGKIQGLSNKAAPVVADILTIQDTEDSNALKELTITNLKTLTDWDGDIADVDLDGGTDVGAALVDADLILVDDGAGGTNRKSTVSRLWTYVTTKIQALANKATAVDADILTIQDSAAGSALKELTLTNLWTYITGKIQGLSNKAAPVVADILTIQDTEDSNALKELTLTNLATLINAIITADMTPGTGISTGTGTICEHRVTKIGGLFKTEIMVDMTGLNDGGTAGDVIGKDGDTANCHIGQILAAVNGTIFAGRITCFEVPAGGDVDVDLWYADEATLAQDTAISAATGEVQTVDHGDWAVEQADFLTAFPVADKYLYLVNGATTDADYTGGIFLIELWGT